MEKYPLVSIGVPVRDGVGGIERCLASLTGQSYERLEIIISDNASSDNTLSVCEFFAQEDNRIRLFSQPVNIGGAANFDFVKDKAEGRFFMWASHDDIWESDFVERTLRYLLRHPEAVAAITPGRFGKAESVDHSSLPLDSNLSLLRRLQFLYNPGANLRFYSLFRSELIGSYSMIDYQFYAGDWLLVFRLLGHGKFGMATGPISFTKSQGGAGSGLPRHPAPGPKWRGVPLAPLWGLISGVLRREVPHRWTYLPLLVRLNLLHIRRWTKLMRATSPHRF